MSEETASQLAQRLRDEEARRRPLWLTVGIGMAAYQTLWGFWLAGITRPRSTPTYRLMRRWVGLDESGVGVAIAGALACGLLLCGGTWRRRIGAALIAPVWAYVCVTLASANFSTTATPTYAVLWALGLWVLWRAWRDG